jgi:hypothetical protein
MAGETASDGHRHRGQRRGLTPHQTTRGPVDSTVGLALVQQGGGGGGEVGAMPGSSHMHVTSPDLPPGVVGVVVGSPPRFPGSKSPPSVAQHGASKITTVRHLRVQLGVLRHPFDGEYPGATRRPGTSRPRVSTAHPASALRPWARGGASGTRGESRM